MFALCHFCKLAVKWSVFYMMVLKPYYHSVSLHIPWYTWKDTMICQPSYMLKHTPLNSQKHEELWLPETKVLEFLVQFWPSHYHAMTCSCKVVQQLRESERARTRLYSVPNKSYHLFVCFLIKYVHISDIVPHLVCNTFSLPSYGRSHLYVHVPWASRVILNGCGHNKKERNMVHTGLISH